MDGLSGASSVIAVVSVALQLAEGVQKLCEFGKAVQDAPANVGTLFGELETLSTVLAQTQGTSHGTNYDKVTEKVLKDCNEKVANLQAKLLGPTLDFRSQSFARRKWSALKITLKKSEIDSLQSSIEKAKSTLMIFKINSIQRSTDLHFNSQRQILLDISQAIKYPIHHPVIQSNTVNKVQQNYTMQIYPDGSTIGDVPPPARHPNDSTTVSTGQSALMSAYEKNAPPSAVEQQVSFPNRLHLKQKNEPMNSWALSLPTPMWSIQARSSVKKVTTSHPWGARESVEKDVDYVFYPTGVLRRIGVSYGFWINAKATSGWKYSLQPFNAVPENSLIFEFCRDGNLSGIQTLLRLGQASLQDRDPLGRTPLWIAAKSLQVEVAEFLLREGADMHVADWKDKCPPITATWRNQEVDVQKKLSTIALFQRYCPDGHDDTQILQLIGLLLFFYRPRKSLEMSLADRRDAALSVIKQLIDHFPEEDIERSNILFDLMHFNYDRSVLHWTLRSIKGFIHDNSQNSGIHQGFWRKLPVRDPVSMRLIVQKTQNLHRFYDMNCFTLPAGTPTSLAMYQPGLFFQWRSILLDQGHDIDDFVRRELEFSHLGDQGWEQGPLTAVFKSEAFPDSRPSANGFLKCDRCGRYEESAATMVDLPWRCHLRSIRNRHYIETQQSRGDDLINEAQNITIRIGCPEIKRNSDHTTTSKPEMCPSSNTLLWPYRIVCSDSCEDGVCVAWVFENDSMEEPCLPPYTPEHERLPVSGMCEVDDCPSMDMPGAFRE